MRIPSFENNVQSEGFVNFVLLFMTHATSLYTVKAFIAMNAKLANAKLLGNVVSTTR